MGGPGSSDTPNQYQPQNRQGGCGNAGINPVQRSGSNPHDIALTTTTANAGGNQSSIPLTQYPATHLPQATQLHQTYPYPQYEQQQPNSTVPPSLFDTNSNPVTMSFPHSQSQMPYPDPNFILDDGIPLTYEPNELAAIEDMLGGGAFNFSLDWNDEMM